MNLKDRFSGKQDDQKNITADQSAEQNSCVEHYDSPGNTRNICFIQTDGETEFLNYAYLVSCKFIPNENMIRLVFTTCTVEIKGQNLRELFKGIFNQTVQSVSVIEERYLAMREKGEPLVYKISTSAMA